MAARVNELIGRFGESVRRFFRDQRRSEMTSPMFNLPGRLVLGSHCYYENLPRLLSEIRRHAHEERIGRAMRALCNRPNFVHLNSLALGFLIGREQARLTGAEPAQDGRAVAEVMDFWSRIAASSRNDGAILPDEAGFSSPILPAETVADLNSRLPGEVPDALHRQIRRMVAILELYTFIFHGEARVGIVHHGPYEADGGDTLVIKELVGLRDEFYPWARLQATLPCDNIACAMRFRDVRSKIDLFGSLTTEPQDYAPAIVSEALFVVADGAYESLDAGDIPGVTDAATQAQMELYSKVMEWDERYRIEYGADLYAYLLKSFGDQLGLGEAFGDRIRASFAESVERHLDDLHSGDESPVVLQHLGTTQGPVFSPLSEREAATL